MITREEIRVLEAQFAKAKVPLRIADGPFVRGVRDRAIVQMDIRLFVQRGRRAEQILLWPGEVERLQVLGADPVERQVVLLVEEREIVFEEKLQVQGRIVTRKRRTAGGERRFLIGMDESHLFIAPLSTPAGSVRQAHAQLRPLVVREAERRGARILRQGEWFFLPLDEALRRPLAEHLRMLGVERRVAIGGGPVRGFGGRRGHVVDERVVLWLPDPSARQPDRKLWIECARGHVRHPDHKVLVLKTWHRVECNTEGVATRARGAQLAGVQPARPFVFSRWVD